MAEVSYLALANGHDAHMWTPADVLRHMLRELESGTAKAESLTVEWRDGATQGHCFAGMTARERVALLSVALFDALLEMRG